MIVDASSIFSDSQAITATAASTNVIDLGAPGTPFGSPAAVEQDIGKESHIPIAVSVTQGFNNLTSLQVSFQKSPDNSTWTEIASRTYLLAELSSPGLLSFPSEIPIGANAEFLRFNYTVTGTAPTTGKIFAGIVAARQTNAH